MDLNKINFWKRLEMFAKNVQVNDAMSEEEKQMIVRIAQDQQKLNIASVSGKRPLSPDCQSKIDGECHLPINSCQQCYKAASASIVVDKTVSDGYCENINKGGKECEETCFKCSEILNGA